MRKILNEERVKATADRTLYKKLIYDLCEPLESLRTFAGERFFGNEGNPIKDGTVTKEDVERWVRKTRALAFVGVRNTLHDTMQVVADILEFIDKESSGVGL